MANRNRNPKDEAAIEAMRNGSRFRPPTGVRSETYEELEAAFANPVIAKAIEIVDNLITTSDDTDDEDIGPPRADMDPIVYASAYNRAHGFTPTSNVSAYREGSDPTDDVALRAVDAS